MATDFKKETYVETDQQYNSGLCLDDYGNEISICKAHADSQNEDEIYLDWIFPQNKDRKPIEKSLPWKIVLGETGQAVKILRYLADMLEKNTAPETPSAEKVEKKDDVPF